VSAQRATDVRVQIALAADAGQIAGTGCRSRRVTPEVRSSVAARAFGVLCGISAMTNVSLMFDPEALT
jgi:hypothetical protein